MTPRKPSATRWWVYEISRSGAAAGGIFTTKGQLALRNPLTGEALLFPRAGSRCRVVALPAMLGPLKAQGWGVDDLGEPTAADAKAVAAAEESLAARAALYATIPSAAAMIGKAPLERLGPALREGIEGARLIQSLPGEDGPTVLAKALAELAGSQAAQVLAHLEWLSASETPRGWAEVLDSLRDDGRKPLGHRPQNVETPVILAVARYLRATRAGRGYKGTAPATLRRDIQVYLLEALGCEVPAETIGRALLNAARAK